MPHGAHLAYWDSDKARLLVNARGMELSNHWGPVDAHTELPAERLAEFFGMRASYYEAPKSGAGPAKPAESPAELQPAAQSEGQQKVPASRDRGPVKLTRPKAKVTALYNPALGLPQSTLSQDGSAGILRLSATRQPAAPGTESGMAPSAAAHVQQEQPDGARPQHLHASAADQSRGASASPQPAAAKDVPQPAAVAQQLTRQQQRQHDRHHNAAVLGMLRQSDATEDQQQVLSI